MLNLKQQEAFVIPVSGSGTVNFRSVEFGPIAALTGTLNRIVSPVLGWETVTNPTAATLGVTEESDDAFRQRRRRTLALQGISISEAITSALNNVPGVIGIQYRENFQDTTQVIDGITLVAHSIWAVVDGGVDTEVAAALLENKTAGSNWNGAQSIPVVDQFSGQTFTVNFDRPDTTAIFIRVTGRRGNALGDLESQIRQAVLDYANGLIPNEDGFRVGVSGSPFEVGSAVNVQEPGIFVSNVEFSTDGITFSNDLLTVALDEKLTTLESSITVVIT